MTKISKILLSSVAIVVGLGVASVAVATDTNTNTPSTYTMPDGTVLPVVNGKVTLPDGTVVAIEDLQGNGSATADSLYDTLSAVESAANGSGSSSGSGSGSSSGSDSGTSALGDLGNLASSMGSEALNNVANGMNSAAGTGGTGAGAGTGAGTGSGSGESPRERSPYSGMQGSDAVNATDAYNSMQNQIWRGTQEIPGQQHTNIFHQGGSSSTPSTAQTVSGLPSPGLLPGEELRGAPASTVPATNTRIENSASAAGIDLNSPIASGPSVKPSIDTDGMVLNHATGEWENPNPSEPPAGWDAHPVDMPPMDMSGDGKIGNINNSMVGGGSTTTPSSGSPSITTTPTTTTTTETPSGTESPDLSPMESNASGAGIDLNNSEASGPSVKPSVDADGKVLNYETGEWEEPKPDAPPEGWDTPGTDVPPTGDGGNKTDGFNDKLLEDAANPDAESPDVVDPGKSVDEDETSPTDEGASGASDASAPRDGINWDIVRTILAAITPFVQEKTIDEFKNVIIKAAEIGAAMGAIDQTGMNLDGSGGNANTMSAAAQYSVQLLRATPIDVKKWVSLDFTMPATTTALTTGGTTTTPVADEDFEKEYEKEIKARRMELLRQYGNVGVQFAEGMNAISADFPARAATLTGIINRAGRMDGGAGNGSGTGEGGSDPLSNIRSAVTEALGASATESIDMGAPDYAGAIGAASDVAREALIESLRATALSSVELGVAASHVLFSADVYVPDKPTSGGSGGGGTGDTPPSGGSSGGNNDNGNGGNNP